MCYNITNSCVLYVGFHPPPPPPPTLTATVMEILHFEDLGDTSVAWLRTQLF